MNGNLTDGNLFTPGGTATMGGRHRADTGSFAQGLKDAAEKTIGGITSLGRGDKQGSSTTASKSNESSSGMSASGGAHAGGDGGDK